MVQVRNLRRVAYLIGLFAGSAFPTNVCRAGLISPDSPASPPVLTVPATQGAAVPPGGLGNNAYLAFGLRFEGVALATIQSTKCWVPVDVFAKTIDYQTGIDGGRIIAVLSPPPNTPPVPFFAPVVSVEFMNVKPGQGELAALDVTGQLGGGVLATANNAGIGPHGGTVATVAIPSGLSKFEIAMVQPNNTDSVPWGVSQLTVEAQQPLPTPEPATLALAGLGAVGLAFGWWRQSPSANSGYFDRRLDG
jgi:hypothetical protein